MRTAFFERIEQLQDRLPDFSDACIEYVSAWGRRKRWDFLMQNMRQLVLKLQHVSEKMHTTLADLEASLNEDEVSGGMASVANPAKRFGQEQMLIDLEMMRQQSQTDFYEGTDLLKRLIELTEPNESHAPGTAGAEAQAQTNENLNVIAEDEQEDALDMSPPRVIENRNLMKGVLSEMVADTEDGGIFARLHLADNQEESVEQLTKPPSPGALPQSASSGTAKAPGTAGSRGLPGAGEKEVILVAIADFEPPASHASQMLRLRISDQVTILGQDGRGWWYGRTQTGKEGWFPPSYVQVKPAHLSAEGR